MAQFDAARQAALMGDLLNIVLRRPADLLPFDEVREELHLRRFVDRGVQDIPLDAIVGTVGRERDFTRAFLPRSDALRDRWSRVNELAQGPEGFPPIDVYRIGDAYFVVDGHHRVSVARSMGLDRIEGRVKEFVAPIRLSPDESLEEVILRGGLADFLEATGLRPEGPEEYRTTIVNGYERLLEHVKTHGYFLGLEQKRSVPWEETVGSWRDTVYRPMIAAIRRSRVLENFPGKTETDLYLFTMDRLHSLREQYGRAVGPDQAVVGMRPLRGLRAAWRRVRDRLIWGSGR